MSTESGELFTRLAELQNSQHQQVHDFVHTWTRSPEQQLERAKDLWPGIKLPAPPMDFEPVTPSEVLLLHVPGEFDALWDRANAPDGYEKFRVVDVADVRLRPSAGADYTGPVWLGFDSEDYPIPCSYYDHYEFYHAGGEVLSALMQFPRWPLRWYSGPGGQEMTGRYPQDLSKFAKAPVMGGYMVGSRYKAPALHRWDLGHELVLDVYRPFAATDRRFSPWVIPRVRLLET